MNMFNIFPPEIWIDILMNIPCYMLPEISYISEQFKELFDEHNLIEKRKMLGFPRLSGHCKSYDVSKFDVTIELDLDEYDSYLLDEKIQPILLIVLIELYQLDIDLVYGDLICFNDIAIYVFDGYKIISIDLEDELLPCDFTVINNNVPIKYWSFQVDFLDYMHHGEPPINASLETQRRIYNPDGDFVWFDPTPVQKSLLDNIAYNDKSEDYYTTFRLNNTNYKIICDVEGAHGDRCNEVNGMLTSKEDYFAAIKRYFEIFIEEGSILLTYEDEDLDDKSHTILYATLHKNKRIYGD